MIWDGPAVASDPDAPYVRLAVVGVICRPGVTPGGVAGAGRGGGHVASAAPRRGDRMLGSAGWAPGEVRGPGRRGQARGA